MPAERMVQVLANKGKNEVELVFLENGHKITDIKWTVEETVAHIKLCIAAVDMIQGKGKSGLILPKAH